jgi:pyrimidine operon attenuation protein/uracil phosphoribosyltransferase
MAWKGPDLKKKILSQTQVRAAIEKLARQMVKQIKDPRAQWALVGIQRRGVPLAERLGRLLSDMGAPSLPVGTLDITFYRDDMGEAALDPVVHDTHLPFDVRDKTILLIDDVLYTGRTVRCALDELMDFGRPQRVCLAALVDRGHRELPVQADFVGEIVPTTAQETVEVHLEEVDGEDAVWINSAKAQPQESRS